MRTIVYHSGFLIQLSDFADEMEFQKFSQSIPCFVHISDSSYTPVQNHVLIKVCHEFPHSNPPNYVVAELQSYSPDLKILLHPQKKVLFIGCNASVHVIDLETGELVFGKEFHAPFYSFSYDDLTNRVLVFHELGVLSLSETWKVKWHYASDDIISTWSIKSKSLEIVAIGGSKIEIDLDSGERKIE